MFSSLDIVLNVSIHCLNLIVYLQQRILKKECCGTQKNFKTFKVLVAEDEPFSQRYINALFKHIKIPVDIVSNGREAVNAVQDNDYHLVILDIKMPVMDGLSAARYIRSLDKPGIKELPIIALTSNGQPEDSRKSFDAGMDDHVVKPIGVSTMKTILAKWGIITP